MNKFKLNKKHLFLCSLFTLFSSLLLLGFLVKNMCPVSIKLFILYAESALFHMLSLLFPVTENTGLGLYTAVL